MLGIRRRDRPPPQSSAAKADVFSFARIVSRIVADNRRTRAVPWFVAALIANGLSAQPSQRASFGAIIARLEVDRFEIEKGGDRRPRHKRPIFEFPRQLLNDFANVLREQTSVSVFIPWISFLLSPIPYQ
jgi:hypothetical protein